MRLEVDLTKRKRRQFTPEFKADAVKLVRVGGRSIVQTARYLDLAETALRGWIRQAEIEAGAGPPGALTQAEREEFDCVGRTINCRWSMTSYSGLHSNVQSVRKKTSKHWAKSLLNLNTHVQTAV